MTEVGSGGQAELIANRIMTRESTNAKLAAKIENVRGLVKMYEGSLAKAREKEAVAQRMIDKYSTGLVELESELEEREADLGLIKEIAKTAGVETDEARELRVYVKTRAESYQWVPGMAKLTEDPEFAEKSARLRELDAVMNDPEKLKEVNRIFYNRGRTDGIDA